MMAKTEEKDVEEIIPAESVESIKEVIEEPIADAENIPSLL